MPPSGLNATFTHGAPDRDLITVHASSGADGVQCVGNVVAGISRLVNFAYFVRLSAAGTQATTAAAYVVDMAARRVLAQCDVTLPSSASVSFTLVTTNFTSSSWTTSGGWPSLAPTKSYWLPFCFAASASTKRSISSFSLGGSGNLSSTVGACSGGPSCEPTAESTWTGGSLATTLSNIAGAGNTQSSGSSGNSASVGIAAGVTVGVAVVLVAAVVCAAVFLVRRARRQPPAALRRSSLRGSFGSGNSPMYDISAAPGCRVTLKQMNDLYAPGAEGFADA